MYLTETVSKCSIWDKITNSYDSFWIACGEWRGVYVRMLKNRKVRSMKKYLSSIYLFPKKKNANWGPQKRHYTLSGFILDPHILNPPASILNSWFAIVSEIRDWVSKKNLSIFFWVVLNIISEQQYFFEGSLDRVHAK